MLSPAATSFDQYKDYKDRGEKFAIWVRKGCGRVKLSGILHTCQNASYQPKKLKRETSTRVSKSHEVGNKPKRVLKRRRDLRVASVYRIMLPKQYRISSKDMRLVLQRGRFVRFKGLKACSSFFAHE